MSKNPDNVGDDPQEPTRVKFDLIKWELANPWLAEGRPDDRTPMSGAVADIGGTPPEQRAQARRSHQENFKKWSQERHD